jgi:hypothetical protein
MGYCSPNSFNPLALGIAILSQPGSAGTLIQTAKSEAGSSTATASASVPGGSSSAQTITATGRSSKAVTQYQSYAFSELSSKYGITDTANKNALVKLWNIESGWNPNARNASSGATGIPQLLPGAHSIPANWSNPQVQIDWGLKYIMDRYGSPSAALAFETSHSPMWY